MKQEELKLKLKDALYFSSDMVNRAVAVSNEHARKETISFVDWMLKEWIVPHDKDGTWDYNGRMYTTSELYDLWIKEL